MVSGPIRSGRRCHSRDQDALCRSFTLEWVLFSYPIYDQGSVTHDEQPMTLRMRTSCIMSYVVKNSFSRRWYFAWDGVRPSYQRGRTLSSTNVLPVNSNLNDAEPSGLPLHIDISSPYPPARKAVLSADPSTTSSSVCGLP